ncbi:MAG TPA: NAD(P)/FAD-dependent oxidoreductase [Beutenbergiaceae bacterium]|nr:NAD(P)/FAD-dependent oxidoreductase [Beutenbergiaceae bacterium]
MSQEAVGGDYDVVVIGAGPVGENVADRAVQGGLRVVIIEAELVGGECSYWACVPSKALLRSGQARRAAQRVPGAAEAITGEVDVAAVLARRTEFASDFDDAGQVQWLQDAGIDLIRGTGEIIGPRRVRVHTSDGEQHLSPRHAVVLCTGSTAVVPDIPGLAEARVWTSRQATAATQVPESLLVLGGGVVACEMASAYADLGSAVTMVVRGDRLLAGAEPFAGDLLAQALSDRGVRIELGTEVSSVARPETCGPLTVTYDDGREVGCAQMLVATGRAPRTAGVGLQVVGLGQEQDPPRLRVDETMRVLDATGAAVDWLYAVGDVSGRTALTHQGKYQARAAGDVIAARAAGAEVDDAPWGSHVATADHGATPQVIFTDPQVAYVGRTAAEAQQAGYRIRVLDEDLGAIAGAALHADGYTGTARIVVDLDTETILGASFVGADVAELLHSATIAVTGQVPLHRLWHAVPTFPTISEVWLRLLEAYGRPGWRRYR